MNDCGLRRRRAIAVHVLFWAVILLFPKVAIAVPATSPTSLASVPASGSLPNSPDKSSGATANFLARFADDERAARLTLNSTENQFSLKRRHELDQLRKQMAADRDLANTLADRGTLGTRILEAQIAALGKPPADGESEPAVVKDRRAMLDQQLGVEMAPVLSLREAAATASEIVKEIDRQIQQLENRRMFERGYSPFNPVHWSAAGIEISDGLAAMQRRADERAKHDGGIGNLLIFESIAIVVLLIGAVVVVMAWRWLSSALDRRIAATAMFSRRISLVLVKDALAALVFAALLVIAVVAIGAMLWPFLSPEQLFSLASVVILASFVVAVGYWIGRSAINSPFPELRLLTLPEDRGRVALRTIHQIAILLALEMVVSGMELLGYFPVQTARLASALLVVAGGYLVWKFSGFLQEAREFADQNSPNQHEDETHAERRSALNFATPISRLLKIFAVLTIAAALVGYVMLSREILSSALTSLAIISVAVYFHRSIALVVETLGASRLHHYRRVLPLVPLATGFLITALTILLLAMVWGYNSHEIGDGIRLLRDGMEFGDVRLSLGDIVTFLAVFFLGYFVTRWVQRFLRVTVMPEFGMNRGAETALITFLGYIGITLAAIVAIATTGLDLSSLAFVAGALSVGLGFGLQAVVENFTSGIILLIERPVQVGDWIEVGEHSGIVRRVAVRATHIETFDRHQIIIPNSKLITEAVKNRSFAAAPVRVAVEVGVAYGSDLERVKAVLLEIAHDTELTLDRPEPFVTMTGFGDSSINLKVFGYVADVTTGAGVQSTMMFAIARRFAEEGIEIPFPQRDVHFHTASDSSSQKQC